MATGTTLTQPQPFGPPQTQKIAADPFAAFLCICAIAGIPLSLAGRKLAAGAGVSGGVGALSLFIFHSRLDDQIQKQGEGMATVSSEAGFTLAALLLVAGAAWNIYLFIQVRRACSSRCPGNERLQLQSRPRFRKRSFSARLRALRGSPSQKAFDSVSPAENQRNLLIEPTAQNALPRGER